MATTSVQRYEPVRERGTLRAFSLAVLMHLLLLAFLYFGVKWQSSTPRGEEAELWDEQAVQQAIQAIPAPEPKPEPVIKAPPAKVEEEADIALEQAKRKREQEAAAAREAELARRAAEEREETKRQALLKQQKEQQAHQTELQRKAQAEQQA
jgi:colicin import membrane protein